MGSGCPKCHVIKQRKPLPEWLSSYWDVDRNNISKSELDTLSYKAKYWWVCPSGHSWESSILLMRNRKRGCLFCPKPKSSHTNRKPRVRISQNQTVQDFLEELPDATLKVDLSNQDKELLLLSVGSQTKIWWVCDRGHRRFDSPGHILLASKKRTLRCNECYKLDSSLAERFPSLLAEWDYEKNEVLPTDISYSSAKVVWWVCSRKKHHTWATPVYSRTTSDSKCPSCNANTYVSQKEKDLSEWLDSQVVGGYTSVRNVVPGYELDYYHPQKKIAVEFNGLYWHNYDNKPKTYHLDKHLACKELGIQLIQIWEDDWENRKEIVKRSLSHKLQVTSLERVGARKTSIVPVPHSEAEKFLIANHIQGSANGSLRVGLTYKGELISLVVLREEKAKGQLNLLRYATSRNVPGGFTKLVAYVEKQYQNNADFDKIITFSDNAISDGNLYKTNGFQEVALIRPDYSYVVKKQRQHKFGYRLRRFREDPGLLYKEGMSESQLASLNKIPKIYDAGKTKWLRNF
jgi:hypothetical protein